MIRVVSGLGLGLHVSVITSFAQRLSFWAESRVVASSCICYWSRAPLLSFAPRSRIIIPSGKKLEGSLFLLAAQPYVSFSWPAHDLCVTLNVRFCSLHILLVIFRQGYTFPEGRQAI